MLEKIKKNYSSYCDFLGEKFFSNIVICTMLGVLSFAVEASFVFVLQGFFVSIGLVHSGQMFLPSWYPEKATNSLLILVLFGICRFVVQILKNIYSTKIQFNFGFKQRNNLLEIGLKYSQITSFKEVISLFGETVSYVAVAIFNLSSIPGLILTFVFYFILGMRLAPYEMFLGFMLLGILFFPLKILNQRISNISKGIANEWESTNGYLLRGLKNNLLINIYNQVDQEIEKGLSGLRSYNLHYVQYAFIASVSSALPALLGVIIVTLLSLSSIYYFKTDAMKLVSFFYIFMRMTQSVSEFTGIFSNVKVNFPRMQKLFEMHEKLNVLNKDRIKKVKFESSEVVQLKAENLSFSYDKEVMLFKDLSFEINLGEVLLIKGESGSGKSTLLSIILGINIPSSGIVELDSTIISSNKYDLQDILGYVGPEPYLVNGTIRENLLFGLPVEIEREDEEIWQVLSDVELSGVITELKEKLNESIGDLPNLSTGQKQRLSIARAVLRRPKLLILDEATANLDSDTEFRIINNLKKYFSNSIVIIVSHKNSFDSLATSTITL